MSDWSILHGQNLSKSWSLCRSLYNFLRSEIDDVSVLELNVIQLQKYCAFFFVFDFGMGSKIQNIVGVNSG